MTTVCVECRYTYAPRGESRCGDCRRREREAAWRRPEPVYEGDDWHDHHRAMGTLYPVDPYAEAWGLGLCARDQYAADETERAKLQ